MTAFLWTYLALGALGIVARLAHMARGETTTTTPAEHAWIIGISLCFYAWAGYLLLKGV